MQAERRQGWAGAGRGAGAQGRLTPGTALLFLLLCRELVECFQKISEDSDCRAVVISGAGKMFTSGRTRPAGPPACWQSRPQCCLFLCFLC